MARQSFHANVRIWLSASVGLFVVLGFLHPLADVHKIDDSFWEMVLDLVIGDYAWGAVGVVPGYAAMLALPAVVFGWVVHAVVVIMLSLRQSLKTGRREIGIEAVKNA